MTNQINHIVEHLFHKKRLDDVSVYEIERFIATHPYFAAGHFLLAKKTQLADPEKTHEKVATTLLYYNNPLWLQWLLDQDISAPVQKQAEKDATIVNPENITERYDDESSTEDDDDDDEIITEVEEEADKDSIVSSVRISEQDRLNAGDEIIDATASPEQQPAESAEQDEFITEPESAVREPEHVEEFEKSEHDSSAQDTWLPKENWPPADPVSVDEPVLENVDDSSQQNIVPQATTEDQSTDLGQSPLPETATDGQQLDADEEKSRATAASIGRTLTTAALIPTRAEMEKGDFTFEPYHTIDYFASQGIKLQQSDLSRDKFGKQLKSFTEWLKSMKRLPQAVAEANMDEATQQSIQRIAEHSFEEKDIVTETMADVWIKQGNKEKAIDTLQKLSLLNPSKSHYFAAKIEQLKAS